MVVGGKAAPVAAGQAVTTQPTRGARAGRTVRRTAYLRIIAIALPLAAAVLCVLFTPWDAPHSGFDLEVFRRASAQMLATGSPYLAEWPPYLYSPAFAVITAPVAVLPFDVALALWRVGGIAALAFAVRGSTTGLWVFALPFLWASDILSGNVMAYATAGMIAVVRWPSVRTVVLYAVMVALIPKPQFLPVLLWGAWHVRAALPGVALAGAFGGAMLVWPGYLDALTGHSERVAEYGWQLPQPATAIAAIGLTMASLRWSRLLGPAAALAAVYHWPYAFVPLAVAFVATGRGPASRRPRDGSAGGTDLHRRRRSRCDPHRTPSQLPPPQQS